MSIETLKLDLEIIKEAIINGDLEDAKQMLNEVLLEVGSSSIIL